MSLHDSAKIGETTLCLSLLTSGSNPNLKDRYGCTPLHEACYYGHKDCIELLLQYHGNPNIQDNDGMTSLHYVVMNGYDECLDVMLKYQTSDILLDLNSKDKYGNTPLHVASSNCHMAYGQLLLKHYAIWMGRKRCQQLLLEYGADPLILNNDGKLPKEIIDLIESYQKISDIKEPEDYDR